MRGNWDTAEPLVHAPNQQRQQQQQTIVEEQRHPLHSPTTPAWGITDRIVKEEPLEDKNNDSGMSPGHYTSNSVSPRSRRSSSTANCSLSPGSATSQDSSNIQCGTFDYSPRKMYDECRSPNGFTRLVPMDDHRTETAMDLVADSGKTNGEEADIDRETFQCPICSFTSLNRISFTEHLTGHYNGTNCDSPDFGKSVIGHVTSTGTLRDENDLRTSPSPGERSETEEIDEPGVRVPRVNSQGKVKTFRCKQCQFVAITKLEFWEHSRGHIKAEKLLTCPKCPFVTEYKHHLEYHLRNHFGSKPFKCDKCPYSCVNKSMLNSHLKSHSNIYQYRCANCSYATKYCHSLKLHLRKYSHQPAMVLNADGSPNPLPIIDVYGTRRGPKQKPTQKNQEETKNALNVDIQGVVLPKMAITPPRISPVNTLVTNPLNGTNGNVGMDGTVGNMVNGMINGVVNGMMNGMVNGLNVVNQPQMMSFPYNQIFTGFPLPGRFPVHEETSWKQLDRMQSNVLMEYAMAVKADRTTSEERLDRFGGAPIDEFPPQMESSLPTEKITEEVAAAKTEEVVATSTLTETEETKLPTPVAPLDLSKPETEQQIGLPVSRQASNNSPRASGTSRRKGRAVKLERRFVVKENESDEEMPMHDHRQQSPFSDSPTRDNATRGMDDRTDLEESKQLEGPTRASDALATNNEFFCQYCEIAFGNVVMYTVHMGYHGYKDPYTCNMCGHRCTDKVSFFLHIARSKHA